MREKKMRKYLVIYEEAFSYRWPCNRSTLNFPIYEENLFFFFISASTAYIRSGGDDPRRGELAAREGQALRDPQGVGALHCQQMPEPGQKT